VPSSLKLVLALVALGFAASIGSLALQHHEDKRRDEATASMLTGGDPRAGRQAIVRYGCGACHTIPGVPRADGQAAPSLDKIAVRAFLAGRLPNQPEQMIAWVRHPQAVNPGGGMPEMGVGERDGRDIAAYLYTLR
jgi:cytochrome c2